MFRIQNLVSENAVLRVTVFDVLGRERLSIEQNFDEVDLSTHESGVYWLQIMNAQNAFYSTTLIVQH